MYSLILNESGELTYIRRDEDSSFIPLDPLNSDYSAYLEWVANGGVGKEVVPQAAVPQSVTRFQAKAALANVGLLDKVEAMMTDANTPILYRLAWAEAQAFERQSATVKAMSAALGLTDQQLDALFTAAAAITG